MTKIRHLKLRTAYSKGEVEEYLGRAGVVKWVEAKDLLGSLNYACVDGREDGLVIASPGGDVALLAEAIISIGKLARRHLDPFEVRKVFRWRVKTLGSFYMHTDEHALGNLMGSLNQDETMKKKFKTVKETLAFLKNPTPRLQTSLMSHIFKADNIGCGHLNLMIRNPVAYGMSRKVIRSIMRAFFNMMWNGSKQEKKKIIFRVLKGDHKEGAVVTIVVPGKLTQRSMIPMIKPSEGKMSIFVFHPQASEFMHKHEAMELVKSGLFSEVSKVRVKDFRRTMIGVLGEGVRETVSRLAFDLPQYKFELSQ